MAQITQTLLTIICSLFLTSLCAEEVTPIHKQQISYLMQSRQFDASLNLYQQYRASIGRHDFEILEQIAMILLSEGARSGNPEIEMSTLFGAHLGGLSHAIDILDIGINSAHPQVQTTAIQFLGSLQDDRCDALLIRSMASEFFSVRMDAAYLLALRKHKVALGQIEALMYRVPPQLRGFFPELFALIGTSDAIASLRKMIDDPNPMVRIASILSAAQHRRDDLLPMIRAVATHANIAEQEACATAIGALKDSKSIPLLKRMTKSTTPEVRLAALSSLYHLGELASKEAIEEIARAGNLFAIQELATITGSEETLALLTRHADRQIRLNASIALLEKKDPRAVSGVLEILLRDSKDLGFQPAFSLGHSLKAWKVVPSSQQHSKEPFMDLSPISLGLREHLLTLALELPEPHFLRIADQIFQTNQLDLVPKTCLLLENMRTENALRLLRSYALDAHPLTRAYCSLILFRLKEEGPYEQAIYSWIARSKKEALLRFRPNLPRNQQLSSSGLLTPEEKSRLLIEAYATIASSHTEQSIDTLLEVIQESHENNRYALAGLLLRAIQ